MNEKQKTETSTTTKKLVGEQETSTCIHIRKN